MQLSTNLAYNNRVSLPLPLLPVFLFWLRLACISSSSSTLSVSGCLHTTSFHAAAAAAVAFPLTFWVAVVVNSFFAFVSLGQYKNMRGGRVESAYVWALLAFIATFPHREVIELLCLRSGSGLSMHSKKKQSLKVYRLKHIKINKIYSNIYFQISEL